MKMKYELTNETINFNGYTLHRIKALKNFSDVKKGDLGGFIEKENNLSHEGYCWVYNNAKVYGDAEVYDNARVSGDSKVCGNARVSGDSKVCDNARIYEYAWIHGYAEIFNDTWVYDNAEVYDNAKVYGHASVNGNAEVYGNAKISGNSYVSGDSVICCNAHVYGDARPCKDAYISSDNDYLVVSPIGSRRDTTTFFKCKDESVKVSCGCFIGTLDEFKDKVIETHKDNQYAKQYLPAIEIAKSKFQKESE